MINKINAVLACLTAALTLSSCLGGDDDTEYTFYDDAAITSITLGTLNKYLPDDKGVITKTTYSGSTYKFNIDQEQGLIFNPDSLPYGTDAEHVITLISAMNNGVITVKNTDDNEYYYYVSTDSLNLTTERQLRIYSQSNKYYRDYTLKLNVHKEDGEAFEWKSTTGTDGNSDIAALQGMKAVNLNGKVYLFGNNGAATAVYSSDQNDGSSWNAVTTNVTHEAEAYKNAVVAYDAIFILNGETLMRSTDGATWQTVKETSGLSQLVAASSWQLFGISASEGFMVSSDGGNTWVVDAMEEGNDANIPMLTEGFTCRTLKTNAGTEQLMLMGKNNANKTVAWTRLADNNCNSYPWSLIEAIKETPQLDAISVMSYDGKAMMIGLLEGKATDVLVSKDGGMNWAKDDKYKLPATITTPAFTSMVDNNNFIWLFYGQDGKVWRGRLNRLGWERQE